MAEASDGWKDGLGDLEALDKQALQLLDVVVRGYYPYRGIADATASCMRCCP